MNKLFFTHLKYFLSLTRCFKTFYLSPVVVILFFFSQVLWLVQYFVKIFCILHKDRTSLVYFDLFSINSCLFSNAIWVVFFPQLNCSLVLYTSFIFLPFINTYSLSSSGGDSYHYLNLLNTNIRKALLVIVVKLGL